MNNDNFSAGVKILLQRMETNPEEFYKRLIPNDYDSIRNVKWHDIMHSIMMTKIEGKKVVDALYLEDAEIDALFEGYKKIRRKAFDDSVMRELLVTEDEKELSQTITTQTRAGINQNGINAMQGWVDHSQLQQNYEQSRMMRLQGLANSAAQAQGLQNAYPYLSTSYTPEPEQQNLISKMAKAVRLK